jgi:hypothetical protein
VNAEQVDVAGNLLRRLMGKPTAYRVPEREPEYWYLYNLVYGIAAAAWEQEGRPVLR